MALRTEVAWTRSGPYDRGEHQRPLTHRIVPDEDALVVLYSSRTVYVPPLSGDVRFEFRVDDGVQHSQETQFVWVKPPVCRHVPHAEAEPTVGTEVVNSDVRLTLSFE